MPYFEHHIGCLKSIRSSGCGCRRGNWWWGKEIKTTILLSLTECVFRTLSLSLMCELEHIGFKLVKNGGRQMEGPDLTEVESGPNNVIGVD